MKLLQTGREPEGSVEKTENRALGCGCELGNPTYPLFNNLAAKFQGVVIHAEWFKGRLSVSGALVLIPTPAALRPPELAKPRGLSGLPTSPHTAEVGPCLTLPVSHLPLL